MKLGRPRVYEDEDIDTFIERTDEYFTTTSKPTISGLALHLGFSDRYMLYKYEKKEAFSHTIKGIRARMTSYYEENVFKYAAGSIFMLKNFGYSDKLLVENKGGLGINLIVSQQTKDALDNEQ